MTIQQQMKATLEKAGIPFREIQCYGSQIVITSQSEATAKKWAALLSKFAKVRGVIKSLDDRKTAVDYQEGMSAKQMRYVDVWRTFAVI